MDEVNGYDPMMDAELVLRFQEGSEGAFDDLVGRHMEAAHRFCLRLTGREGDAEEISQEGFVRAYRTLGSFRGEAHFRTWLFRILINLYRDRLRSRKREEIRKGKIAARPNPAPEAGAELQARELGALIRERIRLLPDRQREVMSLHVERHLGYREIAGILGCSYGDVKMNLCLARKRLKKELEEYL